MTYRRGDSVRVAERRHVGHHRTPGYLKGKRGTVARVHSTFTNPETRAYGGDGLPGAVSTSSSSSSATSAPFRDATTRTGCTRTCSSTGWRP